MREIVVEDYNRKLKPSVYGEARSVLDRLFAENKLERILLVLPPDFDEEFFNFNVGKRGRYTNFPPYGLGLLAAHLLKNGYDVKIINLNNKILKKCREAETKKDFNFTSIWKKFLKEEILNYKPHLIACTCMFSKTHDSAKNVCEEIKLNFPEIPLGIGGVHITNSLQRDKTKEKIFFDFSKVDFFFTYEGEKSLVDFVKIVNKEISIEEISQIYIKNFDDYIVFKILKRPEAHDLNILPSYHLMEIEELSKWGTIGAFGFLRKDKAKIATVLANRGCRARCTFCSVRNFNGLGLRTRSINSVIEELKKLRFEYNINHFLWLDDDFLYNKPKSIKLFNEIIKNNIDITWECSNGVISASCTDEVISAAQDSGCNGLVLGMESWE